MRRVRLRCFAGRSLRVGFTFEFEWLGQQREPFGLHGIWRKDQLNRQGADVGTQYRSVIFHHDEPQRQTAEATIAELNKAQVWSRLIVTQIVPSETFYPAEDYHQGYFRGNAYQPYCQAVISPKVSKLRQKFADKLRD